MADNNVVFVIQRFISLHSKLFLECTPWQYVRTVSLELHTGRSLVIAGMREAAGGRQPAAAEPPLYSSRIYVNLFFRLFF